MTAKRKPVGSRFAILSRGRRAKRGEMNKNETRYADELTLRKIAGEITNWWFEPLSLRLSRPVKGQPARYTPDFMILMPDGLTILDDVKSGGVDNEAAAVRAKCAAEQYPLWKFRTVTPIKPIGSGWTIKEL